MLPVPSPPPSRDPVSGRALLAALQSSLRLLHWAFAALALIYLLSGVTSVGPGRAALVFRFGQLQPEVRGPGLLLALPAPIDRVVQLNVAEQRELPLSAWREVIPPAPVTPVRPALDANGDPLPPPRPAIDPEKEAYTLTGDRNIVRGEFSLRYRISDPIAYTLVGREPEAALAALFYRALTATLAGEPIDPLLGADRERIRQQALEAARRETDALRLGVQLLSVEFRQLLPPAAVAPAFREVASAQVEASTLIERARSEAATLLPAARSEAATLRARAEADASALLARAQGETTAFATQHAEYSKNPDGFAERRLAETLAPLMPRWHGLLLIPAGQPAPRLLLPSPGKTTP